MQAVILAAGRGKRLGLLTKDKPKPLVEINGKSLLEYNMDNLIGFVDEVILVIGYRGEQIKNRFKKNYKGIKLKYIKQDKQLGTGHALSLVKKIIKKNFLVLMGDDLYSKKDIKNCLKNKLCVLAKKVDNPERYGIFKLKKGNNIKDVIEKPKKYVGNLANVGVYNLNKEIFKELIKIEISERKEYELTDGIKNLAKRKNIKCVKVKDYHIPIAYPNDIKIANNFFKKIID